MNRHLLAVAPLGGSMMLAALASADTFTWQGNLLEGSSPADGIYDLKFRLFDAAAGPSQVGRELVIDDVSIAAGALTIDLDFGDGAFPGDDRWLEIDVKADGDGDYTTLAPRQPIHPVPYAIHAQNVAESAVPFNFNGPNAVFTGGDVGVGTTTPDAALTVHNGSLWISGGTGGNLPASAGSGLRIWNESALDVPVIQGKDWATLSAVDVLMQPDGGNVGIGTLTPTSKLSVAGNADFSDNVGIGLSNPDARLTIGNIGPVDGVEMFGFGEGAGAEFSFFSGFSPSGANNYVSFSTSLADPVMTWTAGGNVGIGTLAPGSRLTVNGNLAVLGSNGHATLKDETGVPILWFRSGTNDWVFRYEDTKFHLQTERAPGHEKMTWQSNGNVGIGTTNPSFPLHIQAAQPYTRYTDTHGGSDWIAGVNGGGVGFMIEEIGAGPRLVVNEGGRVGVGTTAPASRLHVNGTTTTNVLTILGGADIVEGFDTSNDEPLEPGMVVVIDSENPGALRASTTPYDSKVAGVVSGAGGVQPGISLGQDGVLDGDTKVAMTGRVYVKCSTENGAILPGDRLTTASIAGHAMKATDRERCDGAVIGKAMTSLDEETGLVLVLVNLQ